MTNQTATQIREIRVFLSSTFRDMDVERTYLVKQVFPKVRAACLERQVGFSEIDLRWGVSEEESKNGATVEICLKEIDRCRDFPPFFVGFLGERYGWVPVHDDLAAYWEKHSESQYALAIRKAIERGISVTELEMELAVLGEGAAEKIAGHALFCLRDSKLTDSIYAETKAENSNTREVDFYDAGQGKLEALKHKIDQSGFLGLNNYTSVEQFGAAVESYLLAQLDRYFPADEVPTPLQQSNAAHAGFRFHRLQNFLPRPDVREQMIKAIEQRIKAPSLGPIIVTGPSGQGKSALMADLARHYQTTKQKAANKKETWRVFDHYIGADNANHLDSWVERILQTLHSEIKDIAGDIPESPKDKIEALSTWISMSARRNNCRYLFILDALDQLSDGGKNLDILTPQTLGPDGILIASAADDTPARIFAAAWQTHIEVPPLTNPLRTQIVTDTLARYRKRLPENLASKLAHAPQSGSPLFLGLALEELRLDARHETLAQLINDILEQPDAEHLFLNNFLLDEDYGRPKLPELAACFMALLGAAKAGLSENELADLLAQPDDPIAEDTGKPRLPQIHLSRILTNLAPFLLNKQGRRAPMHRIFGEAALKHYGTAPVREHLYAHFAPGYGKGENEYEARAAAEALHQITELAKLNHKGQKQARKQLIADLGYLPIPVKLHNDKTNDGEKLALEALDTHTKIEQSQLKELWKIEIGKLNLGNAEQTGKLIRGFGDWLDEWAIYPLALVVTESLLKRQEQLFPPDHLEVASSCNSLGLLYSILARFGEATPLLRRALAIWENRLGTEHPETANALNNLGMLLNDIGDNTESERLLRRALAIREKFLETEHPLTATSLNNLGGILDDKGDFSAAEQLYRRALGIREKVLGVEHPHIATTLNNLAYALRHQGDYTTAEPLFRRSLEICEKSLGPNHPDTGLSLGSLASILGEQGDCSEAVVLCKRALKVCERSLGQGHPHTATTISNLAGLLAAQGDNLNAEILYRRTLAIEESVRGVDCPATLVSINNLAVFLRNIHKFDNAEPLQRESVARHIKIYGDEGLKTAAAYSGLGVLLKLKGELAEAEIYYRKALAIRERELGSDAEPTKLVKARINELLELKGERK